MFSKPKHLTQQQLLGKTEHEIQEGRSGDSRAHGPYGRPPGLGRREREERCPPVLTDNKEPHQWLRMVSTNPKTTTWTKGPPPLNLALGSHRVHTDTWSQNSGGRVQPDVC